MLLFRIGEHEQGIGKGSLAEHLLSDGSLIGETQSCALALASLKGHVDDLELTVVACGCQDLGRRWTLASHGLLRSFGPSGGGQWLKDNLVVEVSEKLSQRLHLVLRRSAKLLKGLLDRQPAVLVLRHRVRLPRHFAA